MSPMLAVAAAFLVASAPLAVAQPKKLDQACPAISVIVDDLPVSMSTGGTAPCGVQSALAVSVPGHSVRLSVNAVDTTDGARVVPGYPRGVAGMRVVLPGKWAVTDVVPTTALVRVMEMKEPGADKNAEPVFVTEIRAMFPRRVGDTERMPWPLQPAGLKGKAGAPQRNLAATFWPMEAGFPVPIMVSVTDFRHNRVVQPLEVSIAR